MGGEGRKLGLAVLAALALSGESSSADKDLQAIVTTGRAHQLPLVFPTL